MRGLGGAVRAEIGADFLGARGGVEAVDGAVEQLQRRDRLVVGHLVAGLVHAREREVAVLARLAVLDAVNDHRRVAGRVELCGVGVVHL